MPRRKSFRDIRYQAYRLNQNPRMNDQRRVRVARARERYSQNIERAYRSELNASENRYNEASRLFRRGNPTDFDRANYLQATARQMEDNVFNRPTARSVYMGLNNG